MEEDEFQDLKEKLENNLKLLDDCNEVLNIIKMADKVIKEEE